MIIKARSISKDHAINVLEYIIKDEKDHIILDSDGADISSAYSFVSDAELYSKQRVHKAFVSLVISPFKEDNLSSTQLKQVMHEVFNELKLENRQFFAVVHQNTETPHIHVVANRIDYDYNTWKDHNVAFKCQSACKSVAKKLGLTSAFDKGRMQIDKLDNPNSEWQKVRWDNIKAIRSIINEVKYTALDVDFIFEHLTKNGVEVDIQKFKNGKFGVSLKYNNASFKASNVSPLISVIPDKTNNSYKANNKLQIVLDRNLERMLGHRTEQDLIRDKDDISNTDYDNKEFLRESSAMHQFIIDTYRRNIDSENEERRQEFLSKKYGRKQKQIGFRVQV